jgi:dienelactone hydrolase
MAMTYNPFERGEHVVGVRTIAVNDAAISNRPVAVELWYPADDVHRGQDFDDALRDRFEIAPGLPTGSHHAVRDARAATDACPLFLYFHGGYGQRRECSHLCTHLASHGYVVASPNFPGDNMADLIPTDGAQATVAKTPIDESARRRPGQASRFIDSILGAELPPGLEVDPVRIGAGGISMGGFTSLAVNSIDSRLGAIFPMCPMFGERSLTPQVRRLQKLLRVDNWRRPVPTLVLTGAFDPIVNADDILHLYGLMATPKRLVVLHKAGHMHFADNAEFGHEWYRKGYLSGRWPDPEIDGIALGTAMRPFAELCTEAQSGGTARALCLAHMDACLKGNADARAFLDGDLTQTFVAALGVDVEVRAEMSERPVTV